jgi:photosystem II stability/assembly factor-like uncharacterized protein
MQLKHLRLVIVVAVPALLASWWLSRTEDARMPKKMEVVQESEEMEQEGGRGREEWEFKRMRDPVTNRIPDGILTREMAWVKSVPVRQNGLFNNALVANNYIPVGPTQNGGRTRAFAYDVRFNGTSNRVVISGGINGGIFRSTDGGATWTFVHPANEIRSVSSIVQDPRPGFQDTWYAGTGEAIGVSASIPAGFVLGNGIFKSTNNGLTWTKLDATADDNPTNFTQFDVVNRLAINPTNGHVYAAIQRRIARSTDGGNTWTEVLVGSSAASTVGGFADVMVNNNGTRFYAAITGRNPDRGFVGVWTSPNGNPGNWTRIAGGTTLGVDSVAGWRAYEPPPPPGQEYIAGWGRVTFALSRSNQNLMYVLYENGRSASADQPEADLFRCDMSTNPFTWTNVSAQLTAKRNGSTDSYFEAQGGYNLVVGIHPTQPNIVFVGGVNLYRSTDGFATAANTQFVGGLSSSTYDDPDNISHVDYHFLAFDPSNLNRMVTTSDGGLVVTDNAAASRISWRNLNSQYQTIQYYHVGINPTVGSRIYFGGCQDNSTTFRDADGILGGTLPDSNDHYILVGGDGCQVGMTRRDGAGRQHLFAAAQEGQFFRMRLFPPYDNTLFTAIKPAEAGKGEFITYFHLDEDNTDFLYYVSEDSLWRTGQSLAVTQSTGWTRMDGVNNFIDGHIFALATTRGPYSTNSHLFIGTDNGRVYRLKDPQGVAASTVPVDITPGGVAGMQNGVVVSDIAVNPRNQDTVIAVVANYTVNNANARSIFWTGNATAPNPTWQMVEGNLTIPSVRSCAIVAKNAGVEYYVGTTSGLFSTTTINAAGTVWSRELGGPMNTAIVNSLAYRWQDNVMVVGTHGNGMFAAYIGDAVTLPTSVNDPIRNDKNFVSRAFPTISSTEIRYQVGSMTNIRRVRVQVTNMSGQLMYDREQPYQDGRVETGLFANGAYVLTVTSLDRKYQFVQKFFKN